jgi:hypothetical protein
MPATASLDDQLVHRCVTDLEPALRGGAQQCRGERSAIDPRTAAAVDRALDLGERRKQRFGLVQPDRREAMILGRAPAAPAGPDLMEMSDLVVVDGDGQRAAHAVAGVPCAVLAQVLDQDRVVRCGACFEALDRIWIVDAGRGRENAGARIGRPADVPAIDQQRLHSRAHEVPGNRRTEHATADHRCVV